MWRLWFYDWRYEVTRYREKAIMWIAWHLPKIIAYWAAIRVAGHATTGPYGDQHPDTVSVMDMLKRWE